jgi:hypothetical protein
MQKKIPIHERASSVKIFEIGEGKILIEGRLTDERFFRSFIYALQRSVEPGIVHDIMVKIIVSLPDLTIECAEAEMPTVPIEMCREVKDVVSNLAGLRITREFRSKVKEVLGGKKGCVHIKNLILFMGTAAVQGSYSYYNRVREDGKLMRPDFDSSLVVNSCHVWREEGPLAPRLEEMKKVTQTVQS